MNTSKLDDLVTLPMLDYIVIVAEIIRWNKILRYGYYAHRSLQLKNA